MTSRYILLLSLLVLPSCSSMKPTGALGDVLEGNMFANSSKSQSEQDWKLQALHERERQVPPLPGESGTLFRAPIP